MASFDPAPEDEFAASPDEALNATPDLSFLMDVAAQHQMPVQALIHLATSNPTLFAKLMADSGNAPPAAPAPTVGGTMTRHVDMLGNVEEPVAPPAASPPVAPPGTASPTAPPPADTHVASAPGASPGAGGGGQSGAQYAVPEGAGVAGIPPAPPQAATDPAKPPDPATVGALLSGIRAPQRPGYLPPLNPPYHPPVPSSNPIGEMLAQLTPRQPPGLRSTIG